MKNGKITKIFNYHINSFFLNKIQEINAIYGQQQIENILCTINHLNDFQKDKINKIKENNIERCKRWCDQHGQPIHPSYTNDNIN